MAWIESHTVLIRHRKVLQLAAALNLAPVVVIGHLHALWHAVLEQQEDGDLTTWPDQMIAHAASFTGDATLFVTELQHKNWLDGKIVHDWLEYAGRYLESKYRTANPKRLKAIYRCHKSVYRSACSQTIGRRKSVHLPNLTGPNLPNLTKPIVERKSKRIDRLAALEAYQVSPEVRAWAKNELNVTIPDDVFIEFKNYWREQTRLRTDWESTFQNRLRMLVARGILKPQPKDVWT